MMSIGQRSALMRLARRAVDKDGRDALVNYVEQYSERAKSSLDVPFGPAITHKFGERRVTFQADGTQAMDSLAAAGDQVEQHFTLQPTWSERLRAWWRGWVAG